MRTKAREVAFQLIFAAQFTDEKNGALQSALSKKEKLDADDNKYIESVLSLVDGHIEELSNIIDKYSIAFPEARIFPADRSILFIALAEIKYMDDIPNKVSINEAANIASAYSSPKSASFISGILSEVIKG